MTRKSLETPEEYRALLLQFIASLCLADHMGDVLGEIETVLRRLGYEWEWDESHELTKLLHQLGVTTLYDTSIGPDPDEESDTPPKREGDR